jgi:hypothetical protein
MGISNHKQARPDRGNKTSEEEKKWRESERFEEENPGKTA